MRINDLKNRKTVSECSEGLNPEMTTEGRPPHSSRADGFFIPLFSIQTERNTVKNKTTMTENCRQLLLTLKKY